MAGEFTESKADLRRRIRTRIGSLSPEQRAAASAVVVRRLRPLLVGRVLLYAALPDEVDLTALLAERDLILPRVDGPDLVLHQVTRPLVPGAWGIDEPDPEDPVVELSTVDTVVVPGRAFDAAGRRLGRGKGFYDRLLNTSALRIGVGFDEQLVETVPTEDHDQRVARVLTPSWDLVCP